MYFLEEFGNKFFIQTFDDNKVRKNTGASPDLVKTFNVDLEGAESLLPVLQGLNERGAGIYFCVNEVEGTVRSNDTVVNIRAAFLDLDGSPLQPALNCNPDIVVQTSPDKFHCYWRLEKPEPADKARFKVLQRGIAASFKGDKSIVDLARVMRIPGFYNMKNEPFLIRHCYGMPTVEKVLTAMDNKYAL